MMRSWPTTKLPKTLAGIEARFKHTGYPPTLQKLWPEYHQRYRCSKQLCKRWALYVQGVDVYLCGPHYMRENPWTTSLCR